MMFRPRLSLVTTLLILSLMGVAAIAMQPPLDSDTYWHLASGRWQAENGAILRQDVFSHTRAGQPWFNHSWLAQMILYACFAALGDAGLALYVVVLAVGGLVFVRLQMQEREPLISAGCMLLAAAAAAIFWSARPQMLTFFLSCVLLYLLWLHREKNIDRLWLVPPLMALWANLHGGFATGFILLVLACLGEGLHWLIGGVLRPGEAQPTLAPLRRLVIVGLVSAAAVSLNPYGPRLLLYPFQTVGIGALRDFIQEWASPNFHSPQTWPFLWIVLGLLAAAGLSPRRLDIRDAVLVLGTAYSAFLAARNIPVFAAAAVPVLALHLESAVWEGFNLRWNIGRVPGSGAYAVLNAVLIALAGTGLVGRSWAAFNAENLLAARRQVLPTEAVAYINQHDLQGPLFNSYNWGGYLIWHVPGLPVYVDGRTDLYGDVFLRDYLAITYTGSADAPALDAINLVLIETGSALDAALQRAADWEPLYRDDLASLYQRTNP